MIIRAITFSSLLFLSACQILGSEDPDLLNDRTFPSVLNLPLINFEDIAQREPGQYNLSAYVVGMSACPEPGGPCHIPDGISIAGKRPFDYKTDHHYFISLTQPRQFFINQSYTFSVELSIEDREDISFPRLRLLGYDLD